MDNEVSGNIMQDITHKDEASMENSNNVSHQNIDIILPDSVDLDWAQIKYAINYKRLIFINNYSTWSSFPDENCNKYIDYSPEQLCHRFLQRVLPNIYEYELTDEELYLLKLLDFHPHFLRTDNGHNTVEVMETLSFPLNEAAIEMFKDQNFSESNFVCENVQSNQQILITGSGEHKISRKFDFNAENAALLSVVLSSDEDLPNCELLNIEELHRRLKAAKTQFEDNGRELQNISISISDLLKKLEAINKLKLAIAKLVDSSYSQTI